MVFEDNNADLASTTCSGKKSFCKSIADTNFSFETISRYPWQEQKQMRLVRKVRTGKERQMRLRSRLQAIALKAENEQIADLETYIENNDEQTKSDPVICFYKNISTKDKSISIGNTRKTSFASFKKEKIISKIPPLKFCMNKDSEQVSETKLNNFEESELEEDEVDDDLEMAIVDAKKKIIEIINKEIDEVGQLTSPDDLAMKIKKVSNLLRKLNQD